VESKHAAGAPLHPAGHQNTLSAETNDGFWPAKVVETGDPVIMRGHRMVRVTVNPVQVNRERGDLRVWDNVDVRLKFTDGEVVNPVMQPDRPRPSFYAARLLRSIVANPQDLRRDDGEQSGTCVYLIPDYEGVAEAIQPLVDWRRNKGIPTEVIVVPEHATNVDVRRAIQDAYFNWEIPPDIITLVGEADLAFSDFMIPTEDVGRQYFWETDYRYVLIEGQDLLPEAAIGRISCRNVAELRRLVDKIMYYEADPYLEEVEWYRRAALMANDVPEENG